MLHTSLHPRVFTAGAATSLNRSTALSEHQKLVKETQKWVAQTFFGTLLKQARESPFRSDLLDGGRGGQAFGALYDQQLADHMSRGAGSKLVNAIVKRIEANKAYKNVPRHSRSKASSGINPSPLRSIHATTALRA